MKQYYLRNRKAYLQAVKDRNSKMGYNLTPREIVQSARERAYRDYTIQYGYYGWD